MVLATYHRKPLSSDCARSSEDHRLPFAEALFQEIKHKLVVHDGIEVVDAHRVGPIMEHDIDVWDPLSKVGLYSVDSVRTI